MDIRPPVVVGTEFGVDSTGQGDKANGYHNRLWSGEQFLKWEGSAIRGELRPFIASRQLIGFDTFQWSELWGDFSPAKDKGYQDTYKTEAEAGNLDVEAEPAPAATPVVINTPPVVATVTTTAPQPQPAPVTPPADEVKEWDFGFRVKMTTQQKNAALATLEQLVVSMAIFGRAMAGVELEATATEVKS
jgi:hypothetical protein